RHADRGSARHGRPARDKHRSLPELHPAGDAVSAMKRSAASLLCLAWMVLAGGACTYGHQEDQSGPYQPLVFPGEARLGASAFRVIDSNYIQIGDHLEHYDLDRDRVAIEVRGNLGPAPATVRSVFSLESGGATGDARARRNSWVTVVLFDLPQLGAGAFSP